MRLRRKIRLRRHTGNVAKPGEVRLSKLRAGFVGLRQRTGPARVRWADTHRAAARTRRADNQISTTQNLPCRIAAVRAGGRSNDFPGSGGALRETSTRAGCESLLGLRKADVPAVHEIVRPRLLAAVPGEGRGAKYQRPGLCRAIGGGRGAVLAEGWRDWRFDCRRHFRCARFLDVVCVVWLGSAPGFFHPV